MTCNIDIHKGRATVGITFTPHTNLDVEIKISTMEEIARGRVTIEVTHTIAEIVTDNSSKAA